MLETAFLGNEYFITWESEYTRWFPDILSWIQKLEPDAKIAACGCVGPVLHS